MKLTYISYQMYACTGVLILTVRLMVLFIKQIRELCLAKTNIVLQQWYPWFIFYSIYCQCMNTANNLFWLDIVPALARCPPDTLHFIRKWITILIISARTPLAHFLFTDRAYLVKTSMYGMTGIYLPYLQTIVIIFLKLLKVDLQSLKIPEW